jgi:hypothetical protein
VLNPAVMNMRAPCQGLLCHQELAPDEKIMDKQSVITKSKMTKTDRLQVSGFIMKLLVVTGMVVLLSGINLDGYSSRLECL